MEFRIPEAQIRGRKSCSTCKMRIHVTQQLQATTIPGVLQIKLSQTVQQFRELPRLINCVGRKWHLLAGLAVSPEGDEFHSYVVVGARTYRYPDAHEQRSRPNSLVDDVPIGDSNEPGFDRAFYLLAPE